jgi:drug/metabolite transporter (DMT)-like permease
MPTTAARPWIGVVAAAITITIWTSFIVVARASASHTLLPLDILALRVIGAGLVLLPYLVWRRQRTRATGSVQARDGTSLWGWSPLPLRQTVIVGTLAGFLYSALAYTGFFFAPATHASVLLPGSLPLWTGLLAVWWLKEPLSSARAWGLACILFGGLLVGSRSIFGADAGDEAWRGDLLFLAASATWSAYGVVVRKYQLDAVSTTAALVVAAVVAYLPLYGLGVAVGMPSHITIAPWNEIIFQAVYQGVGTLVIAGITFNTMVKHFGPVRTTMMTALVPGLSALSAVLFLGEQFSWELGVGLALVTTGILIGAFRRQ